MNLKTLRKKHKLSQIELADIVGFSRSKVQAHENGWRKMSGADANWYKEKLK